MNIAYIVNARIPTEKAHGYQIVRMCSELARLGVGVTLYVPRRENSITDDVYTYYNVEKNFTIEYIDCPDVMSWSRFCGPLAFSIQSWLFVKAMRTIDIPRETIVYTRDRSVVAQYARRGYRVFYDAHNFPEKRTRALMRSLRGVAGIICNSEGTAEAFSPRGSWPTLVAHNAVDVREFELSEEVGLIRDRLGLPRDMKLVTYVGHLYAWKGVDTLIDAADLVRGGDMRFVLVGGTDEDIARYRAIVQERSLDTVIIVGHRMKRDIPAYLRASDVLVIPNIPITKESSDYTSPIKLFEYMASGVPIVASDLPSVRRVISDREALFFPPGDARALLSSLKHAIGEHRNAHERALRARSLVERYSWRGRAEAIRTFLNR